MTVSSAEVPNGGAPDPRVSPALTNPEATVTLGRVRIAIDEFAAAHPDLTPDLADALRQAVVALE